jgi:hypothetical protein
LAFCHHEYLDSMTSLIWAHAARGCRRSAAPLSQIGYSVVEPH